MNFHGTKKLSQMVFHDLWALNQKIVIQGNIWNPRAWNGLLSPVTLILTPFCFINFPFRQGFSYMQVGIWVSWECPVSKKMIFLTSRFKKVLLTWKLRWTLGGQIVAAAIVSRIWESQLVKIPVFTTEFCCCNKLLICTGFDFAMCCATCCSNLLPELYTRIELSLGQVTATCLLACPNLYTFQA